MSDVQGTQVDLTHWKDHSSSYMPHLHTDTHRWVLEGTILDCDDESWDFSFNLNVKSMFHICKAVLPQVH